MIELAMKSWGKGLQTVSLIQAIKEHSTGSLVLAKEEVERLLAGERVVLKFATEATRDEFRKKAEHFGVLFDTF